jgi:hypothetical protein
MMNKVVFSFLNGTSLEVSVWSVDPTSKQESSIGWRVPPAGGRIDGEALPGTECNVRLNDVLIGTYVTTAVPGTTPAAILTAGARHGSARDRSRAGILGPIAKSPCPPWSRH